MPQQATQLLQRREEEGEADPERNKKKQKTKKKQTQQKQKQKQKRNAPAFQRLANPFMHFSMTPGSSLATKAVIASASIAAALTATALP